MASAQVEVNVKMHTPFVIGFFSNDIHAKTPTVYPHYVGTMKPLSSDSSNENKVKWGSK